MKQELVLASKDNNMSTCQVYEIEVFCAMYDVTRDEIYSFHNCGYFKRDGKEYLTIERGFIKYDTVVIKLL